MLADDPFGGEPMAVAAANLSIAGKTADETAVKSVAAASAEPGQSPPAASAGAGAKTITIIDGSSGKRQEVVVPNTEAAGATAAEDRMVERSRHGPLPKIAQDGTHPSEVFARPVKTVAGKPNVPQVAIVIGGLGISAAATSDAMK